MATRVAPYPLATDLPHAEACKAAIRQIFEDVVAFHRDILKRYGGLAGIRDENLLYSAIQRPFTNVSYKPNYTGLEQTADLVHALAQNHAFTDGNKRTAYYVCLYFLLSCGYWRTPPFLSAKEAVGFEHLIIELAAEHVESNTRVIATPYTSQNVAERLDRILRGSRRRPFRQGRLRSGAFRKAAELS